LANATRESTKILVLTFSLLDAAILGAMKEFIFKMHKVLSKKKLN
jgi:hypothetical protein